MFKQFDKVIVLSEGNQIYNDKPRQVLKYFHEIGLTLEKYKNPADQLLKLASCPEKFGNNLTLDKLKNQIISNEHQNKKELEIIEDTMLWSQRQKKENENDEYDYR